jgi:hypothetical protein
LQRWRTREGRDWCLGRVHAAGTVVSFHSPVKQLTVNGGSIK